MAEERLFLRTDDLVKLTGTTYDNCRKTMHTLYYLLGKKKLSTGKYQPISIPEYCDFEGLSIDEVCKALNVKIHGITGK